MSAIVSQRVFVNLFHSDAQRDTFRRRGNVMLLAGAGAEPLDQHAAREMIPFLNFGNARFPTKGGLSPRRAGTALHDRVAAKRAAVRGYERKWAIHPGQIALANAVMSPSDTEVTRANHIFKAVADVARAGKDSGRNRQTDCELRDG